MGKPVKLRPWQRRWIKRIYDNPKRTRRAIVSMGRKNGKTAFAACLLLLHLCGPEARPNSQLYSAAQSREQAAVLFGLAAKMVRMSACLAPFVHIRDNAKQLFCVELGTLYRALSAEVATAYGLSPAFLVHDELGQVKGPRSSLYEALETATGAQDSPLSVVISTQAPNDADLLSILIDDAQQGHDPRTVCILHTADPDLDPFSDKAIKQANPAYGDFLVKTEVRTMAEEARRMPSREAEYRNLVLNQRVEATAPAVSRSVWNGCAGDVVESFEGRPVFGALDLSETADLTSLTLVAPVDTFWHVKPTFWLPAEGLRERARKDRVPYDVWAREGFLETTPGRTVEYEYVAKLLRALFDELDIRCVAFDRWNWKHLRPWLLAAGFGEEAVTPGHERARFAEFGQGFASMSPAFRDLESALLNGRIRHGGHPVLTMCASNAVVQTDPAGNRKLTKAKSHGRIDGMITLVMAYAMAMTHAPATREPEYQLLFVG